MTTPENALQAAVEAAVLLYRQDHPESRAVAPTTWAGSGSGTRRATCIFCREQVPVTSSARYPETKRARQARIDHGTRCALAYLADHCLKETNRDHA